VTCYVIGNLFENIPMLVLKILPENTIIKFVGLSSQGH